MQTLFQRCLVVVIHAGGIMPCDRGVPADRFPQGRKIVWERFKRRGIASVTRIGKPIYFIVLTLSLPRLIAQKALNPYPLVPKKYLLYYSRIHRFDSVDINFFSTPYGKADPA